MLGSSARPLSLPASSRSLSSPPKSGQCVFGSSECPLGLLASSLPLSSSPQSGGVSSSTLAARRMRLCAPPCLWKLFCLFWSSWFCGGGCLIFTSSVLLPPPHLPFSAHPPTQCPSFGEHDTHFVGESHDIGSALPSYVWKVLVHYTGKAVCLCRVLISTSPVLPLSRTLSCRTPPSSVVVAVAKLVQRRLTTVGEMDRPRLVHNVQVGVLAGTRPPCLT